MRRGVALNPRAGSGGGDRPSQIGELLCLECADTFGRRLGDGANWQDLVRPSVERRQRPREICQLLRGEGAQLSGRCRSNRAEYRHVSHSRNGEGPSNIGQTLRRKAAVGDARLAERAKHHGGAGHGVEELCVDGPEGGASPRKVCELLRRERQTRLQGPKPDRGCHPKLSDRLDDDRPHSVSASAVASEPCKRPSDVGDVPRSEFLAPRPQLDFFRHFAPSPVHHVARLRWPRLGNRQDNETVARRHGTRRRPLVRFAVRYDLQLGARPHEVREAPGRESLPLHSCLAHDHTQCRKLPDAKRRAGPRQLRQLPRFQMSRTGHRFPQEARDLWQVVRTQLGKRPRCVDEICHCERAELLLEQPSIPPYRAEPFCGSHIFGDDARGGTAQGTSQRTG
mmetsp:Transcript_96604/g.273107  ORF Transcript_96604/g.273107 Transcript_96604/m.273107 type:complete len:396 (+) Transcript_96604:1284-2471(+)